MIRRFCDFNTIHGNIATCIGWLRGVIKPQGLIGRGVGLVAPDGARSKFSRFPCEVTLAMLDSCMIITLLRQSPRDFFFSSSFVAAFLISLSNIEIFYY
jgi:hypothetical protein